MIKLFEFIISGCWHIWETKATVKLHCGNREITGTRVKLCCKKCGTWKKIDLI